MGSGLSIYSRFTTPTTPTPPQRDRYYTVRYGDDLIEVATNQYGLTVYDPVPWRLIMDANKIEDPFTFGIEWAGRRIRIPAIPLPGFVTTTTPTLVISATPPEAEGALGTSLAFPPGPDGKGGMAVVSGVHAVEDSLEAILTSLIKSHRLEPWLGLKSLVFNPVSSTGAIAQVITEAIVQAEDRVDPNTLQVVVGSNAGELDAGFLPVQVFYQVNGEGGADTMAMGYQVLNSGIRY